VSVLVKIGAGVVAGKILAIFIGPSGMAIIGNFRNTLVSVDTFSTMGIQNGVIKYVAEDQNDNTKLYRLLSTVFISIFIMVMVMSLVVYLFSGSLSGYVFEDKKYQWVFKVLAFTLPWHAANVIFMAVINGLGRFKQVIAVNIAGNLIGVAISAVLIWKLHLDGAMLGLIISPAMLFIFSFYLIQREFKGFSFLKRRYFDGAIMKRLLSYSIMSLVNAVLSQVIFIAIRNTIADTAGIEEAGLWEAMNRISFFYLVFVTTLLTVYFLPMLSMANDNSETKKVFHSYYKSIVPLFIAGCAVVYLLRFFIIRMLFTKEFLPMENLFLWQLTGDIFKVGSLILGYQFFAKKMTVAFIVTEIMSFIILYFSALYFIDSHGAVGAVMAHALTYVVYFMVLAVYFRKKLV
jgi:PST family polysaccharide transporter